MAAGFSARLRAHAAGKGNKHGLMTTVKQVTFATFTFMTQRDALGASRAKAGRIVTEHADAAPTGAIGAAQRALQVLGGLGDRATQG